MGLIAPGHGPVLSWLVTVGVLLLSLPLLITGASTVVPIVGLLHLMAALMVVHFARDPDRPVPSDPALVVAPADGRVMFLVRERATGQRPTQAQLAGDGCTHDPVTGPWWPEVADQPLDFATEQRWEAVPAGEEEAGDVWHLAVFMSPLDVHVNRAPLPAEVIQQELRTGPGRRRGPHRNAGRKDSAWNERVRWVLDAPSLGGAGRLEMTQIAGALARTIVPWVGEGASLRKGERLGFIRLGSRVDLRLPAAAVTPLVDAQVSEPTMVLAGTTPVFRIDALTDAVDEDA